MPEANVKSGALLGFKVGLQSTVDTMLSQGTNANADHGCFYLTKDAHRLYVGNEDGSLSAVNEGIEWIATWTQLQAIASTAASSVTGADYLTGRFYYVQDKNILCVYNGSKWVQLNENSNTTVESQAYTITTASNTSTIENTITDSSGAEFTDSFTVTGANGISITSSGKAITLTGDTYTLSSATGTTTGTVDIKLDSTGTTNDSKVTLEQGQNVTLAKDATSGNIKVTAKDTTVSTVAITPKTAGFEFKLTDSEGAEKTANVDPKIAIYTSPSSTGTTTNSVSFVSGTATLDVYSRAAIDSKIQAVNAMTYRGTVGTTGTGATSITYDSNTGNTTIVKNGTAVPVSIGDTFLTTAADTYNGVVYQAGSLLIVRAKDGKSEDANGIIAVGDFICDVVAEQWNTDTTYILAGITNGIQLHSNTGEDVGSLVVTAGSNNSWIDIAEAETAVVGNANAKNKTLTVTHKDVTRTNTTGTPQNQGNNLQVESSMTIPVITSVTSDAKGHITGIETTNYTVRDTNASLLSMNTGTSAYSTTGSGAYNAGVITIGATLRKSGGQDDQKNTAVVVSSSSLTISDEDTRPTSLGGSVVPGGLKIEMVWGSF